MAKRDIQSDLVGQQVVVNMGLSPSEVTQAQKTPISEQCLTYAGWKRLGDPATIRAVFLDESRKVKLLLAFRDGELGEVWANHVKL